MQEYDFVINHIARPKHTNGDACSRNPLSTILDRWARQDHNPVSSGECVTISTNKSPLVNVSHVKPSKLLAMSATAGPREIRGNNK